MKAKSICSHFRHFVIEEQNREDTPSLLDWSRVTIRSTLFALIDLFTLDIRKSVTASKFWDGFLSASRVNSVPGMMAVGGTPCAWKDTVAEVEVVKACPFPVCHFWNNLSTKNLWNDVWSRACVEGWSSSVDHWVQDEVEKVRPFPVCRFWNIISQKLYWCLITCLHQWLLYFSVLLKWPKTAIRAGFASSQYLKDFKNELFIWDGNRRTLWNGVIDRFSSPPSWANLSAQDGTGKGSLFSSSSSSSSSSCHSWNGVWARACVDDWSTISSSSSWVCGAQSEVCRFE